MVQEGTHNINVTLKGHPKNFWGLFGQKAHNTQQITLFQSPKRRFILNPNKKGQTYNPKCKHKWLPNKTLRFSWDGHMHNMHNTANFSDWLVFQNQGFSLVAMQTSIYQSLLYMISPNQIFTTHAPHTYKYVMHV